MKRLATWSNIVPTSWRGTGMKLRYFFVDPQGQLQKVSQAGVQGLWKGSRRAESLGCPAVTEMRLVSVVCDEDLLPTKVFLLRLSLTNGRFAEENRLALQLFSMPDCISPNEVVAHHTQGWPQDFFRQLAVALDVPLKGLEVPLGVGGPLFAAAALCLTPQRAARYLR
jgi:hypothetical protein